MLIDYPFRIAGDGRTGLTDLNDHIRDLIEQVLFTSPGERVNRPAFGCGLLELLFGPNSDEVATATRMLVQGSLQQWLGDLVQVEDVRTSSEDATLTVIVQYSINRTGEQRVQRFSRTVG